MIAPGTVHAIVKTKRKIRTRIKKTQRKKKRTNPKHLKRRLNPKKLNQKLKPMAMVPLLNPSRKPRLQLTTKRKKAKKKRNGHRLRNVIGLVHVTESVTGRGQSVDQGHARVGSVLARVDGPVQGIEKGRGPGIKNGLVLGIRKGRALATVRGLNLEIRKDLDRGIKSDLVPVTVSVHVLAAVGQRAALILQRIVKHHTRSGHAGTLLLFRQSTTRKTIPLWKTNIKI